MPEMITTDVLPSAQFKILTGTLKAATGNDGKKRLSGVASSTVRDLHGDTMSQTAIMDMERAANDNLTIFLNHKYDVPEDVFGSVENAQAVQRGMDGDGNPNWDLLMNILVDDDNPRAEKTYNAIQKGTKLGLSIGAQTPEGGAVRDKDTGALTINSVILLETSVVSIPANPRSLITNAVKALKKAVTEDATDITDLKEAADVCDSCGGGKRKPKDGCGSGFHKAVEEAVDDSDTVESEPTFDIDAGMSSADESDPQEASPSEPAEDVSEQTEKAAEPTATNEDEVAIAAAHVQSVSTVLESVTAKLADMTDKLAVEKQARKTAEAQRDEAVAAANIVVAEVKSIMERVGKTPVGKKTHFVDAQRDFDHLSSIYSEPFRKLLSQGDTK